MYAPYWILGIEYKNTLKGKKSKITHKIGNITFYLLSDRFNLDILESIAKKIGEVNILEDFERIPFIAANLNSSIRLSTLLKKIQDNICTLIDAEAASVLLYKDNHLKFLSTVGKASGKIESIPVPMKSIAGTIFLEEKTLIFNDMTKAPHFKGVDKAAKFQTKNIVGAPIYSGENKVGVLEVLNKKEGFSKKDALLVEEFAKLIGKKLLSTWELEKMSNLFKSIILSFVTMIDKRDKYTHMHSSNVAKISRAIGEKMGLSESLLEQLEYSAIVHDIGKIGIPDFVLLKKGKLTDEEYKIIQSHTIIGAEILSRIRYTNKNIISGALEHHERLDGSGYPYAKKDGEISLFGRIIALADVYDALTAKRPYKEPWSKEKVLAILKNDSEKGKFDKKIFEVLEKIAP
ncbi:phosphohydrolase [Thermosipho melanesiensis]|uniref:Metal dependent phosphohydrolase n=2 Tax=Thermosipho melanesiensis TaxID=46541 RepID=A6LJV4_THEM4|nr:HD domain-containing phosphohydrolase [Thermosipho melanesiensis]ABR30205.1 metal dependent phosphohydrolase [Thermosipho melanesiensis BI429]APT73403.1 phosphohydrolase [Thermosipho melanesiensis]OOC38217.1 phosphohydrolase [Thermosipho melanesiensis]OOC40046.1 phosphohydrolase [Thermosipho melanesiensis]OOC40066.1 phosphohydrolase [Thermosipho melanesiensis]